eukprot:1157853-Pelagomonas_calceolata.AAC.8
MLGTILHAAQSTGGQILHAAQSKEDTILHVAQSKGGPCQEVYKQQYGMRDSSPLSSCSVKKKPTRTGLLSRLVLLCCKLHDQQCSQAGYPADQPGVMHCFLTNVATLVHPQASSPAWYPCAESCTTSSAVSRGTLLTSQVRCTP